MARVTVNDTVFTDPRFAVLGRSLRCTRGEAVFRMLSLWSQATDRQSDTFHPLEIAASLRCKPERVVETVCGPAVRLGEMTEDGSLRLLLRSSFGDLEWLGELRGTASAGGKARASSAERDENGRFKKSRDMRAEVLSLLSDGVPRRRGEIVDALNAPRSSIYDIVRALEISGDVIEMDDKRIIATEALALGSTVGHSTAPSDTSDGDQRTPAPTSALAPTPALTLTSISSHESERESCTKVACHGAAPTAPTDSAGQGSTNRSKPASDDEDKKRYLTLYELWDAGGREACRERWRSCGPIAGRHRVYQALAHPELVQRSDTDIAHGLYMLHAECAERQRLGHEDPWRWYRNAWKPRVLSMACDIPDEQAARSRVSPTSTRSTQKDWIDEVLDEMREENHDATRPRTSDDGRPDGGPVCCVPTA